MADVFEVLTASESEQSIAKKAAADTLAAAIYDVREKFGEHLFIARSKDEFHDRLALCKDDMMKTVNAHLMPVTGVMRRVCKTMEREWREHTAVSTVQPPSPGSQFGDTGAVPGSDAQDGLYAQADTIAQSQTGTGAFQFGIPSDIQSPGRNDIGPTGLPRGAAREEMPSLGTVGDMLDAKSRRQQQQGPRPLHEIARDIKANWPKVNYAAKPYLDALHELESVDDMYYADPASHIVNYFLANAQTWRGPEAKRIKDELKGMVSRRANRLAYSDDELDAYQEMMSNDEKPPRPKAKPFPDADGEWEGASGGKKKADNTGPVQSLDQTYSPSDGPLIPEGDFHAYQNSVDQNAESTVSGNFTPGEDSGSDRHARRRYAEETAVDFMLDGEMHQHVGDAPPDSMPPGGEEGGMNMQPPGTMRANLRRRANEVMGYPPGGGMPDASGGMVTPPPAPGMDPTTGAGMVAAPAGTGGSGPEVMTAAIIKRYAQWCVANLARPSVQTLEYYAANRPDLDYFVLTAALQKHATETDENGLIKNNPVPILQPAMDGLMGQPGAPLDLGQLPGYTASRTAAGKGKDYLLQADEAITNLLNEKAEEFQESIQPLQQALQTIQYAEQVQQAQNPMGVMPPAGTVNVMPQTQGPAGPAPAGVDPSGQVDPAMLAQLMGMGGGDPSQMQDPNAGIPPAAAQQGAVPPEMQMQARRRVARACPSCGPDHPLERDNDAPGGWPGDEKCRNCNGVLEGSYWIQNDEQRRNVKEMNRGKHHEGRYSSRRRAQISLSDVRIEDREAGLCSGTDPAGHRVMFQASPEDMQDLLHVMQGDLAQNFSGVSVDEEDIVDHGGNEYFQSDDDAYARLPQGGGDYDDDDSPYIHEGRRRTAMPMTEDGYVEGDGWIPGEDFDPHDPDEMEVMEHVWAQEKHDRMRQLEEENDRLRDMVRQKRGGRGKARGAARPQSRGRTASGDLGHCQMGSGCGNQADLTLPLRILGDVPFCRPCAERYVRVKERYRKETQEKNRAQQKSGGILEEWQKWQQRRSQSGKLGIGGDKDIEDFAAERGYGSRGVATLRKHLYGQRTNGWYQSYGERKKALRKQAWSGWGPSQVKRNHVVDGWDWDKRLSAYVASSPPEHFICKCGSKLAVPGYHNCKCGKIWNSYVIGTGGENRQAAVEKFLCREIAVRDNVIVAARRSAAYVHNVGDRVVHYTEGVAGTVVHVGPEQGDPGTREIVVKLDGPRGGATDHSVAVYYVPEDQWTPPEGYEEPKTDPYRHEAAKTAKDGGCTCWEGYERVPGTEPCASGSCRKKSSRRDTPATSQPRRGDSWKDRGMVNTTQHKRSAGKWDGSDGVQIFLDWCKENGVEPDANSVDRFYFTDAAQGLSRNALSALREYENVGTYDGSMWDKKAGRADEDDFASDEWPSEHHPNAGKSTMSKPPADWHHRDRGGKWTA